MGTSQRHAASVLNEPNWGNTSANLTAIAKAIEEAEELASNPPSSLSPKQLDRKIHSCEQRISRNSQNAVRHVVKAAGGRRQVSSGASKAIGKAGVSIGLSWSNALSEIRETGFVAWLQSKGVDSIEGKSCHDIITLVTSFIEEDVVGMDATAAHDALEHIMELLEKRFDNDPDKIDSVINSIMSTNECSIMLGEFFGYYIYSHLSQDFAEKIEKQFGTESTMATLREVRDYIINEVQKGYNGVDMLHIDWAGENGHEFICSIFDKVLFILGCDD